MSANKSISEWIWKGFTVLLSVIVIPCFIWVWDADRRVAALEYQAESVNTNVTKILTYIEADDSSELAEIKLSLELMKRDIQKIKGEVKTIKKNYKRK